VKNEDATLVFMHRKAAQSENYIRRGRAYLQMAELALEADDFDFVYAE
jgi:hypothetical protein